MEEKLKELYKWEIEQFHLNFERDPDYQACYTQAEELWKGEDMPVPFFRLLDASSFLSFAHGFRLGLELAGWARTDGAISPAR